MDVDFKHVALWCSTSIKVWDVIIDNLFAAPAGNVTVILDCDFLDKVFYFLYFTLYIYIYIFVQVKRVWFHSAWTECDGPQ